VDYRFAGLNVPDVKSLKHGAPFLLHRTIFVKTPASSHLATMPSCLQNKEIIPPHSFILAMLRCNILHSIRRRKPSYLECSHETSPGAFAGQGLLIRLGVNRWQNR
jgi:hypothetical protein